ncbi:hypothetical protein IAE22_27735, partial [Bacillus sp. S34]|nr:hypothetical protein [Bacillus sp. S34]
TEVVLGVPGVRSVVPPGPKLATLVRDIRSVLDLPRDGGAVLVQDRADGARIRVVVTTDRRAPTIALVRAVRDAVVAAAADALGRRPADVTVRVVVRFVETPHLAHLRIDLASGTASASSRRGSPSRSRTSTPGPCCSTTGARMKTACTGSSPSPMPRKSSQAR